MTYCRCYSCKCLLRYELKTECGQIFANYFGMTWMHIKILKKFIIYSFSCRFSGNVTNMLIINFCYQLILINLYQQYRSKISEPLNAFPTQSQRVCVCVSTQTQTQNVNKSVTNYKCMFSLAVHE